MEGLVSVLAETALGGVPPRFIPIGLRPPAQPVRQIISTSDDVDRALAAANVGRVPHFECRNEHGDFEAQQ